VGFGLGEFVDERLEPGDLADFISQDNIQPGDLTAQRLNLIIPIINAPDINLKPFDNIFPINYLSLQGLDVLFVDVAFLLVER
jgi:hypothetical protein